MSSGIFNPQNRFWQTLDHFADLLILSLLWLVCSLPLVTAGAPPPSTTRWPAACGAASRCPGSAFGRPSGGSCPAPPW